MCGGQVRQPDIPDGGQALADQDGRAINVQAVDQIGAQERGGAEPDEAAGAAAAPVMPPVTARRSLSRCGCPARQR